MICASPELLSLPETRGRRTYWLRQKMALIERGSGTTEKCSPPIKLGITEIDAALGGGLSRGALHEIAAEREGEIPVATAFILIAVMQFYNNSWSQFSQIDDGRAASSPRGAVLWISEDPSLCENGALYGLGLDQVGIAPERLITVAAPRARDVLWAMEEALRSRAIAVAIGEIRARSINQVATRRLSLAAAGGETLGILLRTAPDEEPSAVATRWIIGAAPSSFSSSERSRGIGPPRLAVHLVRNRRGHLGAWIVEWNSVEQRFELAMHSELMAGAALDRPHRAAVA
jgi:protein ImuA